MLFNEIYSHSMLSMEHANRTELQLPMPFNFIPGYDDSNHTNSQLPFTQFDKLVDCFDQASLTSNKDQESRFQLRTSVTVDDNLSTPTLCHNEMPVKSLRASSSDSNICGRMRNYKKSLKKTVRFADSLGLQLVTVYDLPTDRLRKDGKNEFIGQGCETTRPSQENEINSENLAYTFIGRTKDHTSSNVRKELKLLFDQPLMDENFIWNLESNFVKLETVTLKEQLQLHGNIKVRNIAFHKNVVVRYTIDSWKTCNDLSAHYISSSDNGIIDTFSFSLILPTNVLVERLEFAIRYDCNGMSYWDNNDNSNYIVKVIVSQIEDHSRLNYEGMGFYNHKMSHHFL